MNDKLPSKRENQLIEYFGPTDSESLREDHNFADLGFLDVDSFELEEGGHRF
ncbi:MAG: hypothetical protein ACRD5J_19540 [Nitrososphaeraceae archaeon]